MEEKQNQTEQKNQTKIPTIQTQNRVYVAGGKNWVNRHNQKNQNNAANSQAQHSQNTTAQNTAQNVQNQSQNQTKRRKNALSQMAKQHKPTNFEMQAKETISKVMSDLNNRTLNAHINLGETKPKFNKNALKVIFLGGVGEIGKNMMALEYGNDIIVIDCGATFPSNDIMPGIDLVVPDITYLVQNKHKIRAIFITHGHEDHIGAIPYVIGDITCPIYGSKLANALIQNKLREYPKLTAHLNNVKPGDIVKAGCFSVEFINVCHSIAGSFAFAIKCPVGMMVHTGDFKVDFTPINGNYTDLTRFAELGKQGVLLLTSESTNVEREGHSLSESKVKQTLDELFDKYKDKRLIVATFASNVYRLQELLDLAEKYKRKVTFTGRSMVNVTETSYKIGEIKFNRNNFIDLDDVNKYPDNEVLVISTGSQGEPMSALTRMANGDFQKIKLDDNDCIIMSSSPIPGNEKSVNDVINKLCALGCTIIYNQLAEVHASGHAYREELKLIHNLVKPKFFMPVHGEFRHQKLHKDLAVAMGEQERNIVLAEIGDVIEVNNRGIKKAGKIPSGQRLVDGLGYGDMASAVLQDRKQLAEDGVAVVILGMSAKTGQITSGPDIISRGLVYSNEDDLIKEAKQTIVDSINSMPEKITDWTVLKNNVKRVTSNFFFRKTKRRPMILTIILED